MKKRSISQKIHLQQQAYHYSRTPKRKYGQTRSKCKNEGMQFLISLEEFLELSSRPCFYCNGYLGDSGCGLDRVDNSIGYNIENVVPCCAHCNRMKSSLPLDMFLDKIKAIYKTMVAKELIQNDT